MEVRAERHLRPAQRVQPATCGTETSAAPLPFPTTHANFTSPDAARTTTPVCDLLHWVIASTLICRRTFPVHVQAPASSRMHPLLRACAVVLILLSASAVVPRCAALCSSTVADLTAGATPFWWLDRCVFDLRRRSCSVVRLVQKQRR